jgi:hypothetical protein
MPCPSHPPWLAHSNYTSTIHNNTRAIKDLHQPCALNWNTYWSLKCCLYYQFKAENYNSELPLLYLFSPKGKSEQ